MKTEQQIRDHRDNVRLYLSVDLPGLGLDTRTCLIGHLMATALADALDWVLEDSRSRNVERMQQTLVDRYAEVAQAIREKAEKHP